MPLNKPTISHQLKSVRSQKSRQTSNNYVSPNTMGFSTKFRSHLVSTPQKSFHQKSSSNLSDAPVLSNSELKQCTKLLRNVLSSEENKSTSTDDYNYQHEINSKSVAFKSPDLSLGSDQYNYSVNQAAVVDRFDDRTDAESVTSNLDQNTSNIINQSNHNSSHLKSSNSQAIYCSCHSNNNYTMHDSMMVQGSANLQKNMEKPSICSRCHNIIPFLTSSANNKEHGERAYTKSINIPNEVYENGKLSDTHNRNYNPTSQVHNDLKSTHQHGDVNGDKVEDYVTYLHLKINELENLARATRDADLSRIIYDIERSIQQMIRENSLLSNHLKTIAKTLKWENSALKQKIKNQAESNRDMKSEFKLIRQEHKQKIEELKLEVQLKTEEIRQLSDREKSNIGQLKEKHNALEKEYEQLKSEFQKQILQSCHKDTDIIQLKHFSTQAETKLKDEIHLLTLKNQKLSQDFQICEAQCKKYEQELNHNQLIIKAAREQVVNLLDRHKQTRLETNSSSYRFEPSNDSYNSREWVHQATNLQQVLSMASDNKEKQLPLLKDDKFNNSTPSTKWSNQFSLLQPLNDQSTVINDSVNNFANTNCNNNYASLSSFNPIHSDSTNLNSNFENSSKLPLNFSDKCRLSKSPSDISSTLTDRSFNISVTDNQDNFIEIEKGRNNQINSLTYSDSSSGMNENLWDLPHPFTLKKLSSASSMMSTVSSLRSSDDREFRKGLKRLDTQISRLQNTLQSNMQCR